MHCLWSKWAPPFERSSLATFALTGSYIGSVAALSIGGIIGQKLNWQSIFYVFGNLNLIERSEAKIKLNLVYRLD
jgi:MFS family permease